MIITSAGLVIIHENKILLGHPTGQKWWGSYGIPKGWVDENESYMDAAIRETYEEVGLRIEYEQIDPSTMGYIPYKNAEGLVYKNVVYYVVYLDGPLSFNPNNLQYEEIDWAGFLGKEEASKRIFWRQKKVLDYLK